MKVQHRSAWAGLAQLSVAADNAAQGLEGAGQRSTTISPVGSEGILRDAQGKGAAGGRQNGAQQSKAARGFCVAPCD